MAKYVNLLGLQEEMRHFEQLADFQSPYNVEVDGDATQPRSKYPNNPIHNPLIVQLDLNLQDPLFIKIEMRPALPKENENRHLGRFLQKLPFQMCQGCLFKIVCKICKTEYTRWGTRTMAQHLKTHGILRTMTYYLIKHKFSGSQGQNST